MNEPKLSLDEAKSVVETECKAPRVTEESITSKISSVEYVRVGETGVLCIITMDNGWISTGFAAPVSSTNFREEVGKRYAYDKAFAPLWQLEGYLLREQMHILYTGGE